MIYSQTSGDKIKVIGKITGSDGEELIGASISEKGANNGTVSDVDGNYTLFVGANSTLLVSYVGYISQEVAVERRTTIDFILSDDSRVLDEVVVTALGIKREKKALGYSVQDVKGQGLTESRDANVANALAGKIAGLQIKSNGTGVGGSNRITIRGNNTVAEGNQPLIVVDGIPIDNFAASTDDYWGNSSVDKGSGMGDISPDDIENVSILKGPAASALYGSRGLNGVILVTTKSGAGAAQKNMGIAVNSNITFENPMMTPKFQNEYGQGTSNAFDKNAVGSWGPKMDGSTKEMALGSFPYAARDNDLYSDFLRTGTTWTNSLELTKSAEGINFRAGVTRLDNQSVVPNSGLDRTSINLRADAQMTEWLKIDAKINYINQNTQNRIALARDPNNVFMDNLYRPRSVAFSDYDAYKATNWARPDGKPAAYIIDHNAAPDNVFWSTERNQNSDKRDRYIGMVAMDFTFTDWLSLKLRSGMDNYTFLYDMTRATGNPYWEAGGSYRVQTERFKEVNSDFLFTGKQNWDKFGLVANFGGNIMKRNTSLNNDFSGELEIPNAYMISAGKDHYGKFTTTEKQINSLYGTVSFSYDNMLYLDFTDRNDWTSTLPEGENSYNYLSASASWIFTETFRNQLGPINFGKVRFSYAGVGNDTEPYMLETYYETKYNIKDGVMEVTVPDTQATPIKPERTNSLEAGLALNAWNNRLGVDIAWYKQNTYDQILKMRVPDATGFKYRRINAGNIQNSGWEITLNAVPVKTGELDWNTSVNWSANRNKVIELSKDVTRQDLSLGALPINIVVEEGGSYGDIYGTAYLRDENGKIMIADNGIPVAAPDRKKIGNAMPKGMLGWNNNFTYKNLYLNFLIDLTYGADIFMGSINMGTSFGSLENTLAHRDGGLIVDGVNQTTGAPNTVAITSEQYWKGINGISEAFIYNATNARLRELGFGYNLPKTVLHGTPFAEVKFGLVARNLFMIYSKTLGFDPEGGYSSSGSALGAEYCSMPVMRSIGFNVNVKF
jgi:TonB-linked SusC/RagA family outer membrane protein